MLYYLLSADFYTTDGDLVGVKVLLTCVDTSICTGDLEALLSLSPERC